jgi:hypothetical protein
VGGGGGGGGESDDHRFACLLVRDYLMAGHSIVVRATCRRLAHTFQTFEIRLPEGGRIEVDKAVGRIRPDVCVMGPDGAVVWAFEVKLTSATTQPRPFGWSEHTVEAIKAAVPVIEGADNVPARIHLECIRTMHYTNGVNGLECARPRCPGCVKQDVERKVADDEAICKFLSAVTSAGADGLERHWAYEVTCLPIPEVLPVPASDDNAALCPLTQALKSKLSHRTWQILHDRPGLTARALRAKYAKHVAEAVICWTEHLKFRFLETKRVSKNVEDAVSRWRAEPLGGEGFAAHFLSAGFEVPKRKHVLDAAQKKCS